MNRSWRRQVEEERRLNIMEQAGWGRNEVEKSWRRQVEE